MPSLPSTPATTIPKHPNPERHAATTTSLGLSIGLVPLCPSPASSASSPPSSEQQMSRSAPCASCPPAVRVDTTPGRWPALVCVHCPATLVPDLSIGYGAVPGRLHIHPAVNEERTVAAPGSTVARRAQRYLRASPPVQADSLLYPRFHPSLFCPTISLCPRASQATAISSHRSRMTASVQAYCTGGTSSTEPARGCCSPSTDA